MASAYWKLRVILLMVPLCCGTAFQDMASGHRGKRDQHQKKARFEFEFANYTFNEQDGTATIAVKRTGNLNTSVSVGIVTFDGTAEQDSDYIGMQSFLTFGAGLGSVFANFTIIDDNLFETDESFRVILFRDPEESERVCLGRNSVTGVTIVSNDDRDECSDGSHTCGTNAVCIDTIGSFNCTCPVGSTGNPRVSCSELNPCSTNLCGTNAQCEVRNGTVACTCPPGYTGNAFVECIQLNACSCKSCGTNAECEIKNDRVVCSCPPGYNGNPLVECTHRDECSDGSHTCGTNAVCIDTIGSFNCTCPVGSTGNPRVSCSELNPCSTNPCGTNAQCEVRNGSAVCSCPPGYSGDPVVECTQLNPCSTNPCGTNAQCEIRNGSVVCSCPPGYIGNPLEECTLSPK